MVDKTDVILVLNTGSSSLKCTVYAADGSGKKLAHATASNIGLTHAALTIEDADDHDAIPLDASDHADALNLIVTWLAENTPINKVVAVGHRVVHGGPRLKEVEHITEAVLKELHRIAEFDAEHIKVELEIIHAARELYPQAVQVACFDTGFFRDLPDRSQRLPIARRFHEKGLRRYGFHGLSYQYLMGALQEAAHDDLKTKRVVFAHLGSGASMCAVKNGVPIDTTMGLTPAGGIPMSTRSGDIDPGIAVFLVKHEHMDADELNDVFNFQSGLLGMSGTTPDMKLLLENESADPRAHEAVDVFCYQVKKTIGAYAAAMGGLDYVVISGGMGEQAPKIRKRICEGLEFLGIEMNDAANQAGEKIISAGGSAVSVYVLPTDESTTIYEGVQKIMDKVIKKRGQYEARQ